MMLESEGMVVETADLGEDGLEIGKLYDYDIIVLDIMLPDIDGFEVLRRLRDGRVDTPVLILSGLTESENKVKGLGAGADDYLTKPFDKKELFARIQAVVPAFGGAFAIDHHDRSFDRQPRCPHRRGRRAAHPPDGQGIRHFGIVEPAQGGQP